MEQKAQTTQRLTIKDGKVCLLTNNGTWTKDGTTTNIEGDFLVGGEDLATIIASFNGGSIFVEWGYTSHIRLITGDEKVAKKFNEYKSSIDHLEKEVKKHKDEVERLRKLINDHNESNNLFHHPIKY